LLTAGLVDQQAAVVGQVGPCLGKRHLRLGDFSLCERAFLLEPPGAGQSLLLQVHDLSQFLQNDSLVLLRGVHLEFRLGDLLDDRLPLGLEPG